jgi:predicted amidohydrolase
MSGRMTAPSISIATVQSRISTDVRQNGRHIRRLMRKAGAAGARLAHFSEGARSGYVKAQIKTWETVDWSVLREELEQTAAYARELGIWVVLGCNHALGAPRRPQNSLYVISDAGLVAARYNKRFCSNTEITSWYTPGVDPVTFEIDGVRFGCALCIEVCFPEIFAQYEQLHVDCVLLSSYSEAPAHGLMARAHAATNCYWVSLATPVECSAGLPSALIGPNGTSVVSCRRNVVGFTVNVIDLAAAEFEIPLRYARPWRARARSGEIYATARQEGTT